MKIQVQSDLHGAQPGLDPNADLVIFAGDVATKPKTVAKYFQSLRKVSDIPILYVLGNHEYYNNVYPTAAYEYQEAVSQVQGVHLLDKSEFVYWGVSFIGCTLWTDYDNQRGISAALMGMNDFEFIKTIRNSQYVNVCPDDFIQDNQYSRTWLAKCLAKNFGKCKTVVITHHMPSFSLVSSQYRGNQLNGAFANDLDNLIAEYRPELWVYGHTHGFKNEKIGDTTCVCNSYGYTGERTHFKKNYIVEV